MSKFLLNLLLQISKALLNSKIQFLIWKFFFLAVGPADLAAHPAIGPPGSRWPLSSRGPNPTLPAKLARVLMAHLWKYVFPFGPRLPEPATSPLSLGQPGPGY
jgi:hypothetical protein